MSTPRPRPKVMRITPAAAARVRDILEHSDEHAVALRVGIKKGGCAGMEYTIERASEIAPGDEVIEEQDVRVLVDPKAVLFLLGTEMDFVVDKLSAKFVFNNPNQTSACGCGESVELKPAVYSL
jgi:iron-sulfur cluster assembly protein